MTHQRTYSHTVQCDGRQQPGGAACPNSQSWHGTIANRKADGFVRSKGWHVRSDGRHICPECWPSEERTRYTSHEELTRLLMRAGFERKPCAHQAAGMRAARTHQAWEFRPQGGTPRSTKPLFVVHLTIPPKDAPRRGVVAHGFAYGGPAETDEHWQGRFPSLTAAADWATAHGRGAAA